MCGLSCYFHFDTSQNVSNISNEHLKKSLEYIKHRGPDGSSTYLSPCGRCGKLYN